MTVAVYDSNDLYPNEKIIAIFTSKSKAIKYVNQLKFGKYPASGDEINVYQWDTVTQEATSIRMTYAYTVVVITWAVKEDTIGSILKHAEAVKLGGELADYWGDEVSVYEWNLAKQEVTEIVYQRNK